MEEFGEFDPATPLGKTFCPRISVQQYEEQGSQGTHTALQGLMDYMEEHPEVYKKVIARRRKENAENAGVISFLKSKVMEAIQGENYMEQSITEDETFDRLTDLQKEMAEAYDYAQEAKCNNRRFSKRLASKRSTKSLVNTTSSKAAKTIPKKPSRKNLPAAPPYPPPISYDSSSDDDDSVKPTLSLVPQARPPIRSRNKNSKSKKKGGASAPPPPPPPPPPPGNFVEPKPLKERTNTINSPGRQKAPKSKLADTPKPKPANLRKVSQYGSTTSLNSVGSVHDELMAFDKRKLKSVCNLRSVTGTPCHTPHTRKNLTATPVCGKAVGNFGTECVTAFNSLMIEKFRNARSPPSAVNSPSSGINSPSGFTP